VNRKRARAAGLADPCARSKLSSSGPVVVAPPLPVSRFLPLRGPLSGDRVLPHRPDGQCGHQVVQETSPAGLHRDVLATRRIPADGSVVNIAAPNRLPATTPISIVPARLGFFPRSVLSSPAMNAPHKVPATAKLVD
jgi:hypothetical protein